MNTLKKFTILCVLIVTIFSFVKIENNGSELKLEKINIIDILFKQDNGCRPSSEFLFYVKTDLVRKSRGANTINASIYILDRSTGKTSLLANENILVPSYKGVVSLQYKKVKSACGTPTLSNGDKIIGSSKTAPYCFNELIQFEPIYNSYLTAKNNLLKLKNF